MLGVLAVRWVVASVVMVGEASDLTFSRTLPCTLAPTGCPRIHFKPRACLYPTGQGAGGAAAEPRSPVPRWVVRAVGRTTGAN